MTGHTKIKVWRGPTKGDHKHSTASFGYWFHHDGQLEGGHSHQHHRRHYPKSQKGHNTGHYNPGLYGAYSYIRPQRSNMPIVATPTPTPKTTTTRPTIGQLPTPSPDSEETLGSMRIPVGNSKAEPTKFSNAQG